MSPMISFNSPISPLNAAPSSGAAEAASSTSFFSIFSLVLSIAALSSSHASSLCAWSTTDSEPTPEPGAASSVVVMEAYSRARESLKCASAMTSLSGGCRVFLWARDARASVMAAG